MHSSPPVTDSTSLEAFAFRIQELVLWLRDEGHVLSSIDQHLVERWWEAGYPLEVVLAAVRESGERLKKRKTPPRGLPLKSLDRWVVKAGERARTRSVGAHEVSEAPASASPGGALAVLGALGRDLAPSSAEAPGGAADLARKALEELDPSVLGEAEIFCQLLAVGRAYYDALWRALPAAEREAVRGEVLLDLGDSVERMTPEALEETVEELCRRRLRALDPLLDPDRYWRVV